MKRVICLLAVIGSLEGVSQTIETNYLDTFRGEKSSSLNRTSPDIGKGRWTASNTFNADGTTKIGQVGNVASLPLKIESGKIYTIGVDVTMNQMNGDSAPAKRWAGISLRKEAAPLISAPAGRIATLVMRRNGGFQALSQNTSPDIPGKSDTARLGIILNATSKNSSDWTVSYQVDGNTVFTDETVDKNVSEGMYCICLGYMGGVGNAQPAYKNLTVTTTEASN